MLIIVTAVVLAYKALDLVVTKFGGPAKLEASRNLINDVVYHIEQTVKAPGSKKKPKPWKWLELVFS